jgi:aspartate kinase
MIVQSSGHSGLASISFTVPRAMLDQSVAVARRLSSEFGCGSVTSSTQVGKLSVSGIGMRSHTGVAIRMFNSLTRAGINVVMINTSEVRVNVVVDGEHGKRGLAVLEEAFADARA